MLVLVVGCGATPNYAPVSDLHSPPDRLPGSYVVRRGDTIYSIAFRYGLDFRGLAAANGIRGGYSIFPGQRLRLVDNVVGSTAAITSSQSPTPARVTKPASSPAKPVASAPKPAPRPVQSSPVSTPVSSWIWPAEGNLINNFNTSKYAHNGIDIAGKMEQPVKSAANGVVVYAGNGLVGYGNLLIVKHNEQFLSAYAHNNRLVVKEGDKVSQGQIIARMGDSGTDTIKLHFEIRKNGKPVNPVTLLPELKSK